MVQCMKKSLVAVLMAFVLPLAMLAQNDMATGTVYDSDREPMIGATVMVVGTSKATATDFDGKFYLSGVPVGSKLRLSATGYKPVELEWKGVPIEYTMEEDSQMLDEVVVTAMGITRESKTLTYATQTIKSDELTRIKDNNFINSLQGKSAGLTITPNNSGAGGGASKITLRGSSSILGTNQPLIVLDGVPMQDGMGAQVSGGNLEYGANRSGDDLLSTINPEDIESMTILKGPNAAALYGSAANNGVIVITTKSGQTGPARIDISSSTSIETIALWPQTQQVFGLTPQGSTGGQWSAWGPLIGTRTDDELAQYPYLMNSPRTAAKDFFQTGVTTNNGITINGGSENTKTYFSYNNTYQKGVVPNNTFLRNNVMFKEAFAFFDKKVNLSLSLNWIHQTTKNAPVAGKALSAVYALYRTPADVDMRYFRTHYQHAGTMADEIVSHPSYGNPKLLGEQIQTWYWQDQYLNNPFWVTNKYNVNQTRDRILGTITLEWDIWNNIKYMTRFNVDYVVNRGLNEKYASMVADSKYYTTGGQYYSSNGMSSDVYNDHMLTWFGRFAEKFDLNAAVGFSFNRHFDRSTSITTNIDTCGLPNAFVPQNSKHSRPNNPNGSATSASDSWNYKDWSTALFATVSLGLYDCVYVDGSYRLEWAQSFQQFTQGGGYKSFDYYSAGVNVLLNKFLPKVEWLDQFKWRGSWSVVGNPIPNTLFARQSYNFGTGAITSRPPLFDDPKPETTSSFETGFDVWMFNNKFNFDITYYNSTLRNQFLYVSAASGERRPVNTGKIRNYGLEFSAGYRWIINKDWMWQTGFNIAWNDNRILETYQTENGTPYVYSDGNNRFKIKYIEGGRYGDIYVNSFERDENGFIKINNKVEFDDNGNIIRGSYADASPQMASGTFSTFVGNTTSPVTLGWNNHLNWKNLSLYFLIDGRIGGKILSMTEPDLEQFGLSKRSAEARLKGELYTDPSTGQEIILMDMPDGSGNKISVQKYYETLGGNPQEDYVYDATNFRMRDISLGYQFPNLLGRSRDLFVQFSVKNAFFLYKKAPIDPDVSVTAANGFSNIDSYSLPTLRSYALTLKLNF